MGPTSIAFCPLLDAGMLRGIEVVQLNWTVQFGSGAEWHMGPPAPGWGNGVSPTGTRWAARPGPTMVAGLTGRAYFDYFPHKAACARPKPGRVRAARWQARPIGIPSSAYGPAVSLSEGTVHVGIPGLCPLCQWAQVSTAATACRQAPGEAELDRNG